MKTLMHTKKMVCPKPQKHPPQKTFQIVPTVHKDLTDRLFEIDPVLYKDARVVLDINKSERHIRGGKATREKYKKAHM